MISKKVTQNTTNKGKTATKDQIAEIEDIATPIDHTKPMSILSKICPDNIFANSRTDKLITRAKYETNSIRKSAGIMNKGTPSGKKSLNHFSFWYKIPTIFMPIKKDKA